MKELSRGFYSLYLALPLSGAARQWRRWSRRFRGKTNRLQQVRLPRVSWRQCTRRRLPPEIREPAKANGNVRLSELAILNLLAQECEPGSTLFEIGTFDGRTSLNLAFSSPADCRVVTLDLPAEETPRYALDHGERHMVDKPASGIRIEAYRKTHAAIVDRIRQVRGDSASFDFSPYHDSCSLVFVDGSHAVNYVRCDTENALKLVREGGVILWHDYGIWEDVTRTLEEIESSQGLGLRHIKGTSLVYWRKPEL